MMIPVACISAPQLCECTWQGREVPEAIAQASSGVSAAAAEPDGLKKLYFKVIRAVHPDKQLDAAEDVRLEFQRIFSVLSDAYKKYQEAPSAKPAPVGPTYGKAAATSKAASRRSSFTTTTARR